MTADDQLETTLASWLRDDAQRAIPDGSLAEALAPAIGRRPRPARLVTLGSHWIADTWLARTWPARGVPVLGKLVGIGVAAAVVVAAAVGFNALLGPGVGRPGGGSPSPTALRSPLATPLLPSTFGSLAPATPLIRAGWTAIGCLTTSSWPIRPPPARVQPASTTRTVLGDSRLSRVREDDS